MVILGQGRLGFRLGWCKRTVSHQRQRRLRPESGLACQRVKRLVALRRLAILPLGEQELAPALQDRCYFRIGFYLLMEFIKAGQLFHLQLDFPRLLIQGCKLRYPFPVPRCVFQPQLHQARREGIVPDFPIAIHVKGDGLDIPGKGLHLHEEVIHLVGMALLGIVAHLLQQAIDLLLIKVLLGHFLPHGTYPLGDSPGQAPHQRQNQKPKQGDRHRPGQE